MKNLKLGTSPINGSISAGNVVKGMWKGDKIDVTDNAIDAVFEHLMFHAKKDENNTYGYTYDGIGTISIKLEEK